MEAAMTGPSYTVKSIEAIAESSDMRARLCMLAPGEVIPWHYHTAVTDWYFCLVGILRVETRAPRGDERLAAGARYQIPPKTAHRISKAARTASFCCYKGSVPMTSTRSRTDGGHGMANTARHCGSALRHGSGTSKTRRRSARARKQGR
jgi:quercetin dioxygenase-like cupin family protein